MELTVDGKFHEVDIEPGHAAIVGSCATNSASRGGNMAAGIAQCGACTVHVDGVPSLPAKNRPCSAIIEGKSPHQRLGTTRCIARLQAAWIEPSGRQCGYCSPDR